MDPSYKILDIGAGRGNKISHLRKKGEVTGIDISPEAVRIAKQKNPQSDFFVMSCEKIEFPDSYFNEVHCYDVLEHVTDLSKSLSEIRRVIKPNGKLIVEIPHWRSEQKLIRLHPKYLSEIGHQRIFTPNNLKIFSDFSYIINRTKKKHGIVNLELLWQFHRGITIKNQQGGYSKEMPIWQKAIFMLFNENLFLTPLKYLIPFWFITLPIGLLISQINPKTLRLEFTRV